MPQAGNDSYYETPKESASDAFLFHASATGNGNGGGGDGTIGRMEARIAKLESLAEKTGERLASIDISLAKIETRQEQFATKADLAMSEKNIIKWLVASVLLAQIVPIIPGLLRSFHLIQ